MRLKFRILLVMSIIIVLTSLVFSTILYNTQKDTLLKDIDSKLLTAAIFAEATFSEDYHDGIIDESSVPEDEFLKIVDRNNKLCLELGLQYVWSVMVVDGNIVFTSSTSPSKDVREGDHASFFEVHRDPAAFEKVFSSMETDYSSFHNEWGHGRMVLVPGVDGKGRPYCFGASMSINEVHALIKRTLMNLLVITVCVLFLGLFISFVLANSLSKPLERMSGVAKNIAGGDLDQAVDEGKGIKELGSLAASINFMSTSMREKIKELQAFKENLETEVMRKSQKLLEAQEELIHAEKLAALGQAAGAMAHEFRNQLGVVRNAAYFVKSKLTTKDEDIKRHLAIIEREIIDTDRIIDNILSFSKTKRPDFKEVKVGEVLHESIDNAAIPEKVRIDVSIDEDASVVRADPVQLHHVFFNIILNAVQAMEEEGDLKIKVVKTGNLVRVQFEDAGCGIEEEDIKNIFNPFFTTKFRGTGLGLSTSKTLIEEHDGRISIESKSGKGTIVTVEFPIKH